MKTILRIYWLLAFTGICIGGQAQTGQGGGGNILDASTIPNEMKVNAHSVKRAEKLEVVYSSPTAGTFKVYEVVTVLDSKASDELGFVANSDKYMELDEVDIRMFDSTGRQISRHRKKDLRMTVSDESLIEDGKYYFISLSTTKYPVTIERTSVFKLRDRTFVPAYHFQSPFQSVEQTSYTLQFPRDMGIRYKVYNSNLKAQETLNGNQQSYMFSLKNIPAVKKEENSGPANQYFPYVAFNVGRFAFDNFSGDFATWKDMGLFYNQISAKVNRLSVQNQEQIRSMVKHLKSDKEKARFLYEYLQKNFRYVSIQLGIGGWRPFPADFVHEKKYGDCKGLSNYMEACLAAVNIKSYSAWIYSGGDFNTVDPAFPVERFNHQILCAMIGADTVWLECTSSINDFGHLGNSTENRYAVLLTEKGGVLVKTPNSAAARNVNDMRTVVKINDDGSGSVSTSQFSEGTYKYDQVYMSKLNADDQKRYMIDGFGFKNPDDYEIKYGDQRDKEFRTDYRLDIEKIPDFIAGQKMFIRPRMYSFWNLKMPAMEKRTQDYFLRQPVMKNDTTMFVLPEGFGVDALPSARMLKFDYGEFSSKYWYDEASRTVYSIAHLTINDFRIPFSKYNDAKLFMDKVLEDENQRLVIKKL